LRLDPHGVELAEPAKEVIVFLGLGSNLGDRMANLRETIARIKTLGEVRLLRSSPVYQTEPVGYEAQDDFLNMVIQISTSLSASDLFEQTVAIERDLGRFEATHKGPRTVDVDMLLYGDEVIETYRLSVPHRRLLEREFVLRPLCDIAPGIKLGPSGILIEEALGKVEGEKRVEKIADDVGIGGVV
jgi:2-amino-4-hydroxy-6-hydroxymethyldihydropteridine diphosphokinase